VSLAEDRILATLRRYIGPRSSVSLFELSGLASGDFYPALFRLEQLGVVRSHWSTTIVGPYRRRVYELSPENRI
jgi:hypothetical protein